MDPVLLTTFGTLIVLLIFTVPIGVSIGTAVFMGMMVGGLPPVFLAQKMYSALDSFPLLAVPFFIVAGDIMQKGTIANSLLAVSRCLVGHIKGGMAHISILTSLFYGALERSAATPPARRGRHHDPRHGEEATPRFATAVNSLRLSRHHDPPSIRSSFSAPPPAFPSATSSWPPSFPASSWAAPSCW